MNPMPMSPPLGPELSEWQEDSHFPRKKKRSFLGTIIHSVMPDKDPPIQQSPEHSSDLKQNTGDNFYDFRFSEEIENPAIGFPQRTKRNTMSPLGNSKKTVKIYPEELLTTEADQIKTPRRVLILWEVARKIYLSKCANKK